MNYQIVVDLACNVMFVSFPIALVFMITQKIVATFTGVVFGKDIHF